MGREETDSWLGLPKLNDEDNIFVFVTVQFLEGEAQKGGF